LQFFSLVSRAAKDLLFQRSERLSISCHPERSLEFREAKFLRS
jgi:hypothetical protein